MIRGLKRTVGGSEGPLLQDGERERGGDATYTASLSAAGFHVGGALVFGRHTCSS